MKFYYYSYCYSDMANMVSNRALICWLCSSHSHSDSECLSMRGALAGRNSVRYVFVHMRWCVRYLFFLDPCSQIWCCFDFIFRIKVQSFFWPHSRGYHNHQFKIIFILIEIIKIYYFHHFNGRKCYLFHITRYCRHFLVKAIVTVEKP